LDIGTEEHIANRQKDRERGKGRFGLLGEHCGGSLTDGTIMGFNFLGGHVKGSDRVNPICPRSSA